MFFSITALGLAMGIVMYISAVNDEVSHRKKTMDKAEKSFQYHYGWAFFFCGATFICSMVAAISNISLYLLRYSSLDDKAYPDFQRFGQSLQESSRPSTTLTLSPLIPSQLQFQQPLAAALYISIGGRFKEARLQDDQAT